MKCENLQPFCSFKSRGACFAISKLGREKLRSGVFGASAGNFAQGLGYMAKQVLDMKVLRKMSFGSVITMIYMSPQTYCEYDRTCTFFIRSVYSSLSQSCSVYYISQGARPVNFRVAYSFEFT